ncbi:hypothetical protein V1525DRAFT_405350 [Lipomyces kononenkoae]|uniref:Uncharacterized protein n=1 Tax=Lipomyces kononenkoae TaxID=34357 RepID=A0ACC3SZE0_LIPKO
MPSSPKVAAGIRRIQNFTPATYATEQIAGQKRRRVRNAVSCDPCRIRKVKCDQGQPCGPCKLRARQSECTYGGHMGDTIQTGTTNDDEAASAIGGPPGGSVVGRSGENHLHMDRMMQLELKVEELQEMVLALRSEVRTRSQSPRRRHSSSDRVNDTSRFSSHNKSTVQRNGLIGSKHGALHFIGPTGWTLHHQGGHDALSSFYHQGGHDVLTAFYSRTSFEDQWQAYLKVRDRYRGWRVSSMVDCVSFTSAQKLSHSELISLVPERSVCNVLVDRFLVTFNKTHPIVDEDTLRDEISSFWDSRPVKSNNWLPYLLAVLSIGLLLPVNSLPEGGRIINGRFQGRKILTAVLQLLFSTPSYFRRPDTRVFQIMLLSILARKLELLEPDGSDAINGLLAITRQMSYSMGLHRDVSNKVGVPTVEYELRRNLWTTFIFIDLEHSVQCGMPFLLRTTDFDTRMLMGISGTESPYLYCIRCALPLWIEIVQAANSCSSADPSPPMISGVKERLRELTALIDEHLPAGICSSSESLPEAKLVHEVQRSILHCFNSRMLMVVQTLLVQDPSSPLSRNTNLSSAVTVLEHACLLADLVRACPESLQDAWRHLVVSELFCQFSYASLHILNRICRTLESVDPPLPSLFQTNHGTSKYDLLTLHEFLEQSGSIMDDTVHHSPSAVKASMLLKCLCADARERIRLANIHLSGTAGPSAGPHPQDGREIFNAMSRAMTASLELSRMAVDRAAASSDPPPLLCEETEESGLESASLSNGGQRRLVEASKLEITDSSGNTGANLQPDYNMNNLPISSGDKLFDTDWATSGLLPFDLDDWWMSGPESSNAE